MPLQVGHSFQSESLIALEFVPLHRSPLTVFPHRRLIKVALYPALPHSVQDVTGIGRLADMSALSRTITREVLAQGLRPWYCVDPSLNLFRARQMVDAFLPQTVRSYAQHSRRLMLRAFCTFVRAGRHRSPCWSL